MHAFKRTTEQIRGPSLSTSGLSLISDGDWRASLSLGDHGASVAPATRRPLCFHCVGDGPWHTHQTLGPPQVPLPRDLLVCCAQSSEEHSKPCLQPLLAQGRVWAWRVFWVWQPLKSHDNNVPWAGVIMYLAERWSSCCHDGSWMLPRVVLRCFGFVSHSLL